MGAHQTPSCIPSYPRKIWDFGSVETHMDEGSYRNHENYLRGSPGSGSLFKHGGAMRFLQIFVIDPPRGRPIGGGGVYRIGSMRVTLIIIPDVDYFYGKTYYLKINAPLLCHQSPIGGWGTLRFDE
jgi:hypothetical protein